MALKDELTEIERGFWTGGEWKMAFHSQIPLENEAG